ncbi:MAG: efflux RND transporter periplasmic adaptor subunit [Candidatus Glassbacteria bacterium]|nr:efflux RND transporter periplasmic adaptor subunit [Candidatus Glassbacteria bacterium]
MNNGLPGKIRDIFGKVPLWALLVAVFLLGFLLRGGGGETAHDHAASQAPAEAGQQQAAVWTCAMHPQVRQPEPGKCPICGMDLIPVADGGAEGLGPRQIKLGATARELAEVQTAKVERRRATHSIRMPGRVSYDETRVFHITAWAGGRIDRLYVDYTGMRVRKGQPVAELYSPELYSAQEELLQAIKGQEQFRNSALASIRRTAETTVTAARRKLELYGLTEEQIEAVVERGEPTTNLNIYAPIGGTVVEKNAMIGMYVKTGTSLYKVSDLSTVWVEFDAYESDLPWLKVGQEVSFTTPAFPGEKFSGTISFIDPMLDPKSRTVDVRVVTLNHDGRLKPEMLASAIVESRADPSAGNPLMVPATAPLITGKRAVVYVRVPGDDGLFEGREVVLGPRAGDYFIIREGLSEGEEVVTNGAFKIDAAVQIAAGLSMMSPEGGGAGSGMHDHSAMTSRGMEGREGASMVEAAPEIDTAKLPEQFTDGLAALYSAYFAVHEALAADLYEQAVQEADSFTKALAQVKMSVLSADQHMAWMGYHKNLKNAAEGISAAGNIASAREAFERLSSTMVATVKNFGGHGDQPLVLFHCPMAFDNRGAEWLQNDSETRNPYYGSMMPGCMDRVNTLFIADGKGN